MQEKWNGDKVLKGIRQKLRDQMEVVGAFVEGAAKQNLTDNKNIRTGNTRQSGYHTVIEGAAEVKGRIGFTSEAAGWIEFGTPPHVITPKSPGGVLVFEIDGETIFTKKVNHPGTQAYPFLRPALLENKNQITKILAGNDVQFSGSGIE